MGGSWDLTFHEIIMEETKSLCRSLLRNNNNLILKLKN